VATGCLLFDKLSWDFTRLATYAEVVRQYVMCSLFPNNCVPADEGKKVSPPSNRSLEIKRHNQNIVRHLREKVMFVTRTKAFALVSLPGHSRFALVIVPDIPTRAETTPSFALVTNITIQNKFQKLQELGCCLCFCF